VEPLVRRSSVYVFESQPIVLEGLKSALQRVDTLEICGVSQDFEVTLRQIAFAAPDILLIGKPAPIKILLPLLTLASEADHEAAKVLFVDSLIEVEAYRALQLGARGVVGRDQPLPVIADCLETVGRGSIWFAGNDHGNGARRSKAKVRLTKREREVAECVCRGMKNREIGSALAITSATVKVHLMHVFEKTGFVDRFQLALLGRELLTSREEEEATAENR
jgi:two-component system nitrate/nitrite response regulator NarL